MCSCQTHLQVCRLLRVTMAQGSIAGHQLFPLCWGTLQDTTQWPASPVLPVSGCHRLSSCILLPGRSDLACAGVQISRATKLLSHLARNGSLKSRLVERSRDALQGLVLTPDRLICGNLGGTVYVFSIHQVYKDLVSTSFEDQSPQDDGLSVVTRAGL